MCTTEERRTVHTAAEQRQKKAPPLVRHVHRTRMCSSFRGRVGGGYGASFPPPTASAHFDAISIRRLHSVQLATLATKLTRTPSLPRSERSRNAFWPPAFGTFPERPERGRPRTEAVACVLSTVPAQISTDGHERPGSLLLITRRKDKPDDGRASEHQQSAKADFIEHDDAHRCRGLTRTTTAATHHPDMALCGSKEREQYTHFHQTLALRAPTRRAQTRRGPPRTLAPPPPPAQTCSCDCSSCSPSAPLPRTPLWSAQRQPQAPHAHLPSP